MLSTRLVDFSCNQLSPFPLFVIIFVEKNTAASSNIAEQPIGYSFSFFQTIFLNRKCKSKSFTTYSNIIFPRKIISSTETQIRVRKYLLNITRIVRSFLFSRTKLRNPFEKPIRTLNFPREIHDFLGNFH